MDMVKVIHEELLLLLVLEFDDVFDLHNAVPRVSMIFKRGK